MTFTARNRGFAVLYSEVSRWDVKFFSARLASKTPLVQLAPFVEERNEKVKLFNHPHQVFRIFGVSNTVGVFHAYDTKGSEINQPYKRVKPGDFFYNPYRVNVGSLGVVPPTLGDGFVSPAYVVFRVDENQVVPSFLETILTSPWYNGRLRATTTGSVRQNLTFNLLGSLEIPLPPLHVQREIVTYLEGFQISVRNATEQLDRVAKELDQHLKVIYNSSCRFDVIKSRYFALTFKDLTAWDAKSGRAASFRLACPSFRPMGDFIEEATDLYCPADQPDKEWPLFGVNNKDGVFLNSYQKGLLFNASYKRICKDWFFHNPTRCNVGSLGIVPEVPEDAITSPEYQVWRLKTGIKEPLIPGYVACLIQTPFFLELVQFNRVGAVKQRMYTENLMQVHIPYLPVAEQQRYAAARDKALVAISIAKKSLTVARAEVEVMILGTKKVGSL
ncbi:MAG: restriction endonuclease subunit S [bacterium]